MINPVAQLFQPDICELEIQPVNQLGAPATLPEIANRIRVLGYRCEICNALLGARVKAEPSSKGIKVHPYIGNYHLVVPCIWCKHEQSLSNVIRAHQEAQR